LTPRTRLTVSCALAILSAAAMLAFSKATFGTLIGVLAGDILVIAGLLNKYTPAAVFGALVAATSTAASTDISTLTGTSTLITATLGLFLPVIALTWLALSAEDGEIRVGRRPFIVTSAYAVISLLSVLIAMAVGSAFFPAVTARMSTMTDIAIVLFVAAIGAVVLTSGTLPVPKTEDEEEASLDIEESGA
jgi:hypothetical protein